MIEKEKTVTRWRVQVNKQRVIITHYLTLMMTFNVMKISWKNLKNTFKGTMLQTFKIRAMLTSHGKKYGHPASYREGEMYKNLQEKLKNMHQQIQ